MSSPSHDLPPDAFSPLTRSPDPEQQQQQAGHPLPGSSPASPADDGSDCSPTDPTGLTKHSDRQPGMNAQPQSILKKKGSFHSRTQVKKSPQQQHHHHYSIHPILKRNSAGSEIAASVPVGGGNQVHPILKKSSSEERTWWREEPLRIDASSSSAAATPRPILKKRSSVDEVVRVAGEIRPILKRKDSPKSDPEFMPKPIIKSLSRNGSDESNSSPTGHTSGVMIQEPFDTEPDGDMFTGPFMARVMQPRRKSHPVSTEDLRILNHPLLNGKRSPLPFCSPENRMPAQQSPHQHHQQHADHLHHHSHPHHDHHFVPRRSPPLLKSLPTSPSSGFERMAGTGVTYTFVDEFDKKLSLAAELNSSPITRNGDHPVNNSHLQPDNQ